MESLRESHEAAEGREQKHLFHFSLMVLAPHILTGQFGASMRFLVLFALLLVFVLLVVVCFWVLVYLFVSPVTKVEARTSCMLGKHSCH